MSVLSNRTLTKTHTQRYTFSAIKKMQIKPQCVISIYSGEWLQLKLVAPPKRGKVVEKVGQWCHAGIINLLEKQFAQSSENKDAWPSSRPHR